MIKGAEHSEEMQELICGWMSCSVFFFSVTVLERAALPSHQHKSCDSAVNMELYPRAALHKLA